MEATALLQQQKAEMKFCQGKLIPQIFLCYNFFNFVFSLQSENFLSGKNYFDGPSSLAHSILLVPSVVQYIPRESAIAVSLQPVW